MKINLDKLLRSQATIADEMSAFLLFGPDQGLISETISQCIAAFAGKPADPFLVSELVPAQLKADPPRLYDELFALSLLGGRKIIVVREATDSLAAIFEQVLNSLPTPNFLLVDAGDLPARSKLRKAFEASKRAGAAGCYGDDNNNLQRVIQEIMEARGIRITSDAILELSGRLGNDRMVSRNEIEKLALYAGDSGHISINDVINIIQDNASISIESVVFFTADGNLKLADQSLVRALADGISPIQIIRALQAHFQRLHMVAGELKRGNSINSAIASLKPPIFFKLRARFQKQCAVWLSDHSAAAMDLAMVAEKQCKKTGAPMAAICQRVVLRLALAAQKHSRTYS